MRRIRTLLLVHTQHNDDLVSPHSDEFLNRSDTSSGQFAEQDKTVDVVIFKQLHVGAHLCDLCSVSGQSDQSCLHSCN